MSSAEASLLTPSACMRAMQEQVISQVNVSPWHKSYLHPGDLSKGIELHEWQVNDGAPLKLFDGPRYTRKGSLLAVFPVKNDKIGI